VDEGGVNHRFAVRVIIAGGIAADLGAFAVLPSREEGEVVHRVEDAALGRFETVTGIGQGPGDDDGHRVIEEGGRYLFCDIDLFDLFVLRVHGWEREAGGGGKL